MGDFFKGFDLFLNIIGNAATIGVAGLTFWLYFTKKETIKRAIDLLLSFSMQISLLELKALIEKLNNFSTDDVKGKEEILSILNEIEGHINGNEKIKGSLSQISRKARKFINQPNTLVNASKRNFIAESKSLIFTFSVKNLANE